MNALDVQTDLTLKKLEVWEDAMREAMFALTKIAIADLEDYPDMMSTVLGTHEDLWNARQDLRLKIADLKRRGDA